MFVGVGSTENLFDFKIDNVGILGIILLCNSFRKELPLISDLEVSAVLTLLGASSIVLPKSKIEIAKAMDMLDVISSCNLSEGVYRLIEKTNVKIYGNNVFCIQSGYK